MNRKCFVPSISVVLALALCGTAASAQSADKPRPSTTDNPTQTFYLTNISETREVTEVLTAMRNMMDPTARVFLVPSMNAIVVNAPRNQIELAQKLISDLDRPRRSYRLTYTLTESDAGKRIGVQHFTMIVVSGERTTMKQGSRVPVATGSYDAGKSGAQTQFTYLDIGLNFDATLNESVNGVNLRTKAEQSSIAEGSPNGFGQDPVVRQTVLEGTGILTPGKPLVLGSLDIPGSTRHQDVEVVMEVVK